MQLGQDSGLKHVDAEMAIGQPAAAPKPLGERLDETRARARGKRTQSAEPVGETRRRGSKTKKQQEAI